MPHAQRHRHEKSEALMIERGMPSAHRRAITSRLGRVLFGCGVAIGMVALTGCMTIENIAKGDHRATYGEMDLGATKIYGGTRTGFLRLGLCGRSLPYSTSGSALPYIVWGTFAFFDLPLSLVADTVVLPYTIPRDLSVPDPQ